MRAEIGIGRLFDSIRDAVIVADVDGTIHLWNPAATSMFGWTAAEAEGGLLDIIVPPRLRERHRAGLERYRQTGHGRYVDADATLSLPGLRKDGSEIEVEMVLSPIRTAKGDRFIVAILRDVTMRRRDENALREANDSLRLANEDLEAFTYVVSHDLKEPVRALDALLDALATDHAAALPPDARKTLDLAQGALDRLWRQLDRLLEYGRATRGDLEPVPVSTRDILASEACAGHYQGHLRDRGATLEIGDVPPVLADETTLCQVLGNLVSNAAKHNPGPHPRIRVEGERVEGMVEVRVLDNGPGFPPRVLTAFREGAFAPGAGPRGGFGLAIARRAIARLGGTISLENSVTGGVVRFRLPAAHQP